MGSQPPENEEEAVQPPPHSQPPENEEEAEQQKAKMMCEPMLMSLDLEEPLGPKLWILGEPVLRKYYTVYNLQAQSVGFGLANHLPASVQEETLENGLEQEPS